MIYIIFFLEITLNILIENFSNKLTILNPDF